MSGTGKEYRTVLGIVQFPPRDGEAGGKTVRNIVVRQNGFGPTAVLVSATIWPSHEGVQVGEGDVVILEGPYTQNKGTKQDGSPVTYHNLSVSKILVLGTTDAGDKPAVDNAPAADTADDDDIPF